MIGELEGAKYHGDVRLKRDMCYLANALQLVLYKEEELYKR